MSDGASRLSRLVAASALGAFLLTGAVSLALGFKGSVGRQDQNPTVAAYQAPTDVDTAGLKGPAQPIFFRHDIHAGQYQIDCRYCHYAVEVSPHPGIPSMSTCMGCHLIAGLQNPEVQKLIAANAESRPIEWVEVHRMAPFVHFPHMRHVNAGVQCQACHGPVETMPQVYQYSSLKMGWCITCHEKENVTTDCTACHY